MAPSNLSVLTKSHNIIASKKRGKKEQVKEVLFDDIARREFLTGFHKRKLEKKENAKKKAMDREKQERLETRREQRRMLAQQARQNAAEVEKAYGGQVDDEEAEGEEWNGIDGEAKEEEFEDEEQLATVTVVEDFDPDALIHGPDAAHSHPSENLEDRVSSQAPRSRAVPSSARTTVVSKLGDKVATNLKKSQSKTTAKSKPAKYQTNAARKLDRTKQRRRKVEKAERAGGKSARKKGSGRGKR